MMFSRLLIGYPFLDKLKDKPDRPFDDLHYFISSPGMETKKKRSQLSFISLFSERVSYAKRDKQPKAAKSINEKCKPHPNSRKARGKKSPRTDS